jgi:hypothetical protein
MIGRHLREFFARLSVFRRVEPVDSVHAFCEFLATRAAFVSQKKLYEYVKQRMGLSYPKHFEDDLFIRSLNIAKWHVYAAGLSDLAIWMAAQAYMRGADADEAAALSRHAFGWVVAERFDREEFTGDADELIRAFGDRAALADWAKMAEKENAFRLSPQELVRRAPISDELKNYDTEIVINSIRFAWLGIRDQFRNAFDAEAVLADWRGNHQVNCGR